MLHISKHPLRIRPGLINIPGATPQSKRFAEKLLQDDRDRHHCFFNELGFHNHLSHHILAAYDIGAPAKTLQAIYDEEKKILRNIDLGDQETTIDEIELLDVTVENWTTFLGVHKNYASLLVFFTTQVTEKGPAETIEEFVFSACANEKGANMLFRFVAGLFHPLIQTGYGAEFGSDTMFAQGLAQTAVSDTYVPELFESSETRPNDLTEQGPLPLLEILRLMYDSSILEPVMPYDPNRTSGGRLQSSLEGGHAAEIRRLAALWWPTSNSETGPDFTCRVEELVWMATLLFAGTSKPGRKPRLDFFLMHILTMTLFLPSLLDVITRVELKERLLKTMLPVILMVVEVRGRPRINPELIMNYTSTPHPPVRADAPLPIPDRSALTDPRDPDSANIWPAIIGSVVHAPDAHTVKVVRSLLHAAQQYGTTPAGGVPGAFRIRGDGKEETHKGMAEVDGSVFVRAAGVVMNVMGWVTHGQEAGRWDFGGIGWDESWSSGE